MKNLIIITAVLASLAMFSSCQKKTNMAAVNNMVNEKVAESIAEMQTNCDADMLTKAEGRARSILAARANAKKSGNTSKPAPVTTYTQPATTTYTQPATTTTTTTTTPAPIRPGTNTAPASTTGGRPGAKGGTGTGTQVIDGKSTTTGGRPGVKGN